MQALVDSFRNDPSLSRVLTYADGGFETKEELGCLMADALRSEFEADISVQNSGGVRLESKQEGDFTVNDVYMLDPFGNEVYECSLTGEEVIGMLGSICRADGYGPAYVSGINYSIRLGKDHKDVKDIRATLPDGRTIDRGQITFSYYRNPEERVTREILQMKKEEIRRHINGKRIAMVFQDPMTSLNPLMPVGKQIMEGMIWHYHTPKEEAYKKALELMKLVGITDAEKRIKNYPHQLSGGMRQRIVIAIALACDPELLICDEPTTALDVTIQSKILELIQEIQKKRQLSVIYITHDLGVVAKVADYVNVMYAGKIVESGTVEDVFYDPRHPYTWGLLSAMPDLGTDDERLYTIPGSPPNLLHKVTGDAFAPRNKYALNIDSRLEPPMFKISETHSAATWLLHPKAPKVDMPPELRDRIERMKKEGGIA